MNRVAKRMKEVHSLMRFPLLHIQKLDYMENVGSKDFRFHVLQIKKDPTCHACKAEGCKGWCPKCGKVAYCSRKCQVKDWRARHESQCELMQVCHYIDNVSEVLEAMKDV